MTYFSRDYILFFRRQPYLRRCSVKNRIKNFFDPVSEKKKQAWADVIRRERVVVLWGERDEMIFVFPNNTGFVIDAAGQTKPLPLKDVRDFLNLLELISKKKEEEQ
ncbi:MAG TPA: hypothetical protein VGA49_00295 [Patescibacteria group bacterium]